MATPQERLKSGIVDLQQSLVILAQARQTLVVTAISLRDTGSVADVRRVNEFEAARRMMVDAAYKLDNALNALQKTDYQAWVQMLGAFNKYAQTIPGVNISSVSIGEIVSLAVPPFPKLILQPFDNQEIRNAVNTERQFYAMKPARLGFLPAALAPLVQTCSTAITAATVATAGTATIVVAAACGLGALAVIAGGIYIAAKGADVLLAAIDLFNPAAAASRAEAERLKALADTYRSLDTLTAGLSPEEKAKVIKDFGDKGLKPPDTQINWTLVAGLAVAAFAVYAMYVLPKREGSR